MYGILVNSSDLYCFDADGTKKQTIFKFVFSSVFEFCFFCVCKELRSKHLVHKKHSLGSK